jgi:hypothetical protein
VKVVIGLVAGAVVLGALLPVTVRTRTIFTCILCRTEKTAVSVIGFNSVQLKETEFTEWYKAHRPVHEHLWGRVSCTRGYSIYGTTTLFSCGKQHPAAILRPAWLRRFAETADANTLERYFTLITSTNRESQREGADLAWDEFVEADDSVDSEIADQERR